MAELCPAHFDFFTMLEHSNQTGHLIIYKVEKHYFYIIQRQVDLCVEVLNNVLLDNQRNGWLADL